MSQSVNSVNTSIVVFEYENKKMAAQCNDIIESIFNAQIVPKLEEVINHKIPKEVAVDLDSIEIDIGTIKAHEFNHELDQRIKNAFEIALEAKLSILQNSIINNTLKAADTPFYYLEVALEFYMVNGYFPIWFDAKKSLNQLDENIFDTSNTIILNLIQNYIDNKIALKRLSSILTQQNDSIIKEIAEHVREKGITSTENEKSEPIFENYSADEIRMENAGLIIFWPFLTRLFEQLNLMENGLFISPSAQNRAIYLLQYLVNNNTKVPEFELVLNKILVGMPISEHLEPIDNLSLEEKNMITSLMNGLIQNWPKMQNSTSIGIQETFIQREGILSIDKEHYKLVITKKTVDILVASIPWNLSLIKLPWMQKPMHIEWI